MYLAGLQAKFETRGYEENEGSPEFCINISQKIKLMVSPLKGIVPAEQEKEGKKINQAFPDYIKGNLVLAFFFCFAPS